MKFIPPRTLSLVLLACSAHTIAEPAKHRGSTTQLETSAERESIEVPSRELLEFLIFFQEVEASDLDMIFENSTQGTTPDEPRSTTTKPASEDQS